MQLNETELSSNIVRIIFVVTITSHVHHVPCTHTVLPFTQYATDLKSHRIAWVFSLFFFAKLIQVIQDARNPKWQERKVAVAKERGGKDGSDIFVEIGTITKASAVMMIGHVAPVRLIFFFTKNWVECTIGNNRRTRKTRGNAHGWKWFRNELIITRCQWRSPVIESSRVPEIYIEILTEFVGGARINVISIKKTHNESDAELAQEIDIFNDKIATDSIL